SSAAGLSGRSARSAQAAIFLAAFGSTESSRLRRALRLRPPLAIDRRLVSRQPRSIATGRAMPKAVASDSPPVRYSRSSLGPPNPGVSPRIPGFLLAAQIWHSTRRGQTRRKLRWLLPQDPLN